MSLSNISLTKVVASSALPLYGVSNPSWGHFYMSSKKTLTWDISRQALHLGKVAWGTWGHRMPFTAACGAVGCANRDLTGDAGDLCVQVKGCGRLYSQDVSKNRTKGMLQDIFSFCFQFNCKVFQPFFFILISISAKDGNFPWASGDDDRYGLIPSLPLSCINDCEF